MRNGYSVIHFLANNVLPKFDVTYEWREKQAEQTWSIWV
jgi:hypothetical protein